MKYYSFEPKDLTVPKTHQFLLSGVAPRPIALVSTISEDGTNNLSPFSFFNAFGANPPMVAFSPARRGRDNTVKDTYNNIISNGECVIHAVNYNILEQVNLASCEYTSDIDEFQRAGFTAIKSDIVKPMRVKESSFHMECKLYQMIELGGKNASGNLAICEVVKFHVAEDILGEDGMIDAFLIDHVGRNGKNWYTRSDEISLFEVDKPGSIIGIGFNNLPKYILNSDIFTAGDLGRFALVDSIPDEKEALDFISCTEIIAYDESAFYRLHNSDDYQSMLGVALHLINSGYPKPSKLLELTAQSALRNNDKEFAWKTAIYLGIINNG